MHGPVWLFGGDCGKALICAPPCGDSCQCADERDSHEEDDDATSSGIDNQSMPLNGHGLLHRVSNLPLISAGSSTAQWSAVIGCHLERFSSAQLVTRGTFDKDRYEVMDGVADESLMSLGND